MLELTLEPESIGVHLGALSHHSPGSQEWREAGLEAYLGRRDFRLCLLHQAQQGAKALSVGCQGQAGHQPRWVLPQARLDNFLLFSSGGTVENIILHQHFYWFYWIQVQVFNCCL